MIDLHQIHDSIASTPSKIVLLVADGLGGLAHPETRKSELETARIPHLDALAQRSACGLTTPVEVGVAPGSGPGHLALFGYNPLKYFIGRGALEALGIGVDLQPGDVAARGNFCTVDDDGLLTDRRAGRIATELSRPLCEMLDAIAIPGVQVDVYPVQDYRFVLRLRGDGLSADIEETDPQREGVAPRPAQALSPGAEYAAGVARQFVAQAGRMLSESEPANMALLRGWRSCPICPISGAFIASTRRRSPPIRCIAAWRRWPIWRSFPPGRLSPTKWILSTPTGTITISFSSTTSRPTPPARMATLTPK